MRGWSKSVLIAVGVALAFVRPAEALLKDDSFTSLMQPGNALVMPFNATKQHTSFILVSNISTAQPQVTTHWIFWSDACDHLADVSVCLTSDDTAVIDVTDIRSILQDNTRVGPKVDLSGFKGFVTVTAFATDSSCTPANELPGRSTLVDNVLVGTYTAANLATNSAFGSDAIAFGEVSNHTKLSAGKETELDIQTFNPNSLDDSEVVLIALEENTGEIAGEMGAAASTAIADAQFFDNLEVDTSLPDVVIKCATFTSMLASQSSSPLIPAGDLIDSSGFVHLSNIRFKDSSSNQRWVYATHGQAVGQFGALVNGKYLFSLL
jgi:hypothetical protein